MYRDDIIDFKLDTLATDIAPKYTLPFNWEQRDYQEDLWKALLSGKKRVFEVAHRRWGKDDVCLHWTAKAAHDRVGSYWHCLPQYSQARKAIWTAVNPQTGKRRIDEAFPLHIREKTLENEMFIRFKNGSTWQLVGSDNASSTLVGAGVCGVTFSEFALCNPSSYAYINPMLVENNGWLVAITTPRGQNFAHALYQRALKSQDEEGTWFAQTQTVEDTGALNSEALEMARQDYHALYGPDIGEQMFLQEYYCDWTAGIMGAFYAHEMRKVREQQRIRRTIPMPFEPVHRAWDIGVKDDTTIIWFQVQGDKPVIFDCYSTSGVGIDHYADIVHNRGYEMAGSIDWVPHDARNREWGTTGGRTRIESMQMHGLNPRVCPQVSKQDGMQAVRKTLQNCIFDHRLADNKDGSICQLVLALEQYRREWDDDKKTFRASEYRDWTTHPSDAFRYLSLSWKAVVDMLPEEKRPRPSGTVLLEGPPKPQSSKRIKL
jgi:phage terminase large subunit